MRKFLEITLVIAGIVLLMNIATNGLDAELDLIASKCPY